MAKAEKRVPIIIPGLTVFLSSACIMIIELVAGRLIARFLGSSLYTWTSVIGVVLAGITLGNYLGGRIADKYNPRKTLAMLFALASASCVVIIVLNNTVGEWMFLWRLSWPVRVFSHVALVFLLPSAVLGMISPVVAKMALDQGFATGRTVGDIYAFGAAGSIAGTFLAGFYLIAAMGTTAIIWAVAAALLVLAFAYWIKLWPLHVYAVVFIITLLLGVAPMDWCETAGAAVALRQQADPDTIYEAETPYCYVAVQQTSTSPDRRLFMQDKLRHSEIVMDNLDDLKYFYTHIYAAVSHGVAGGKDKMTAMVIGGGGYVYPRYLHKHFPDSRIDVVEIDPGVTKAAIEAFGLPADTPINSVNLDARNYVDGLLGSGETEPQVKYDLVFEDAINDYSVPFQLVTEQFNEKIRRILTDDGVYLVNLIDFYDSGLFLGSVIATLEKTFSHVYVATEQGVPGDVRNTYVVIASLQPLDLPQFVADYRKSMDVWHLTAEQIEELKTKAGGFVLTDDYAPVENMLAPVVLKSASEFAGLRYLSRGMSSSQQQQYDRSIQLLTKAALAYPQLSVRAYNEMGLSYAAKNEYEKAVEAFRQAIEYDAKVTEKHNVAVASVYFNLGVALHKLNRGAEAQEAYKRAIADFRKDIEATPDAAELRARLGDALASIRDFNGAAAAFREAVRLDPDSPAHHFNLARALEFQGRIDDAMKSAQAAASHFRNSPDVLKQFRSYIGYLVQKKQAAGGG